VAICNPSFSSSPRRPAKAIEIVRAQFLASANIEALRRASKELLKALKLAPGQLVRA